MSDKKIRRIVLASMMTAIIIVATMFLMIPIPNLSGAYINAGDAAVYAAAYVLGGPLGALCAAVGSALADILLGSVIYAPATFVIKGGMGLLAGALCSRISKKKSFLAPVAAGLIMPLGYFLYECFLVGSAAALIGLPFNLIQYAGGVLLGAGAIKAIAAVQERKRP